MANSNNENPIIGQQFQASVNRILSAHFGQRFDDEVRIPIGNPPKDHKFDCVSEDRLFTPPQNVSKLTVLPVQLLMDIMSISS